MQANKSVHDANNPFVGVRAVPPSAEMQAIVHEAACPVLPGELIAAQIMRAARKLKLEYGRARRHWYGLVKVVPAEEADRLRAERQRLLQERLRELDAEAAILRARLGERTAA